MEFFSKYYKVTTLLLLALTISCISHVGDQLQYQARFLICTGEKVIKVLEKDINTKNLIVNSGKQVNNSTYLFHQRR